MNKTTRAAFAEKIEFLFPSGYNNTSWGAPQRGQQSITERHTTMYSHPQSIYNQ